MEIDEYAACDATGLAALIAAGQVSVAEVEAAARRAIEVVNPHLNAVAGEPFAEALAAEPDGALAGVPMGLKDSSPAAIGVPSDYSSRALEGNVATSEGELMRRFRAAGLAAIVRTTAPELHMHGASESDMYGITRNPWNTDMTPGGSSGGSAALVGARALPVASAGDGGGSARMPAGFCGAVGLLPTTGRVSYAPAAVERAFGLGRTFALVRSMRDTALLLDLVSGGVTGDRSTVPPPTRPFAEEVAADPGRLRIGLCTTSPFGGLVDQVNIDEVARVGRTLESMGHSVDVVEPPLDPDLMNDTLMKAWAVVIHHGVRNAMLAGDRELTADLFEPSSWLYVEHGRTLDPADVLDVFDQINTITRPIAAFFETIDVLVTPTNPSVAVPVGIWNGHQPFDRFADLYHAFTRQFELFSSVFNITAQPAISLPLGHDDGSGMPVGIQFAARWGDEATLIRLGSALENALPWSGRVAPINAAMGG